jgi:hypothetical protein
MDNNARRILDAARANVARISSELEPAFAADALRRETYAEPLRYVRQAPHAPKAQSTAQETEAEITDRRYAQWDDWAEQHVERGLERAADIFGEEIAEIEKQLLARIEALEAQVGEITAELTVERAARSDNVVDLPSFLRKSNSDAA